MTGCKVRRRAPVSSLNSERFEMTTTTESELYYDPYDGAIYSDPYPVFRRLREEAPLYYNERFDFYALSRFDDVEKGLFNYATFSSARGGILEQLKANLVNPQDAFTTE